MFQRKTQLRSRLFPLQAMHAWPRRCAALIAFLFLNTALQAQHPISILTDQVKSPWGLALDGSDNLYIAQHVLNPQILKVNLSTGGRSIAIASGTISGQKPGGAQAKVQWVDELAVDAKGNLFFNETFTNLSPLNPIDLLYMFDAASSKISLKAGVLSKDATLAKGDKKPATAITLHWVGGIATDAEGNVYVTEHHGHRVLKIDKLGNIEAVAGNREQTISAGTPAPALNVGIGQVNILAIDKVRKCLYVATRNDGAAPNRDSNDSYPRILKVDKLDGSGAVTYMAGNGSLTVYDGSKNATEVALQSVQGLAVDEADGTLYLSDMSAKKVFKIDIDGKIWTVAGGGSKWFDNKNPSLAATQLQLGEPSNLAVDSKGNIYFSDRAKNVVLKVTNDAMTRLQEGNQRFVGTMIYPHQSAKRRVDVDVYKQHPFAQILSCSDSRVPPEVVFDRGLGDLFVVRTAGNVPLEAELGSLDYGAEHLKIPLLVVLGHSGCGAVKATFKLQKPGAVIPGKLSALVNYIKANCANEIKNITDPNDAQLDRAVCVNAAKTAANLRTKLKHTEIVAMHYDLKTGKVTRLDNTGKKL